MWITSSNKYQFRKAVPPAFVVAHYILTVHLKFVIYYSLCATKRIQTVYSDFDIRIKLKYTSYLSLRNFVRMILVPWFDQHCRFGKSGLRHTYNSLLSNQSLLIDTYIAIKILIQFRWISYLNPKMNWLQINFGVSFKTYQSKILGIQIISWVVCLCLCRAMIEHMLIFYLEIGTGSVQK